MNQNLRRAWGTCAEQTVKDFVELLGERQAVKLLEHFPGRRIPAARHLRVIVSAKAMPKEAEAEK
jgi:hypothetical protein